MRLGFFVTILFFASGAFAHSSVLAGDRFQLIPGQTSSCLAQREAGEDLPEKDIQDSYIRINNFGIQRAQPDADMVITSVKVQVYADGQVQSCLIVGDALTALDSRWYYQEREAIIRAGVTDFRTDCALYCGGLKVNLGEYPGSITVRGYTVNKNEETSAITLMKDFSVDN